MKHAFLALIATTWLVGCSTTVYNVNKHPMPASTGHLSLEQVETAIVDAGQRRGWRFQQIAPGHLLATIERFQHTATVDVFFDQDTYSIVYNSSTAPKIRVDAAATAGMSPNTRHPNYNLWVRNLEQDIWVQVSRTAPR